jgi:hypothetical protein
MNSPSRPVRDNGIVAHFIGVNLISPIAEAEEALKAAEAKYAQHLF